ncbi:hypothetical protein G8J22_01351 [Lentilactobacillus hilgardii]|uniref:hypothetical protein n=1 Tax=Lentilactobacillus hilgardii TaxID=1588 RepID=UPI00019C6447|nr:hypothetical protein [Lentilactobacillus hilgardii]EEI18778.1 hypothetical protein HMPREF0497_2387 [Lentilactobacillus buchneri ATCC 11577]QIR09372.1 hypothetical protein G8J22_01351 [Lentilactobacillus hilgardii]
MLKKNYSTLALLFASNVLDGGKDIEKVPTQLKNEVKELIKSLEADTETDLLKADGKVIKDVANDLGKNDTQEVAK